LILTRFARDLERIENNYVRSGNERALNTLATVRNWTDSRLQGTIPEVRIICIGAHPDDCEIGFGGTASKVAALGHAVKFLSVTNGAAGHYLYSLEKTASIRKLEAHQAAQRLGIAAEEVLDNRDGEFTPTLDARNEIVRQIRRWEADVVLTHRPWDYHPDHRYTSQVVQDSAYLVMVPHICPDTQALPRNPLFLYLQDGFHLPARFSPEIVVDIDDAWDQKIGSLSAHASQFYEWLPWVDGRLDEVPEDLAARLAWLDQQWSRPIDHCVQASLDRRYGAERGRRIQHAEAFQVCEYGRRPTPEEMEDIFPR
jgi:LmbE family N-acetylglucosaminyl deacetylase